MLPVELYELIIGHLRHDTTTLKACSLTCKTFLHLSWCYLFYKVVLYGCPTERFFDAIRSIPSPCTYVRYLSLNFDGMNKALPFLIPPRLLDVTSLELDFHWNALDDTQRALMLSGFQKVTYLYLDDAWFAESAEMGELIASFPLLEHLHCSPNVYWTKDTEPMIPLPQSINKITLRDYHSNFFDQLLSLEPRPNVRAIEFFGFACFKEVNKLLKTLGSHLEDLQVGKINS
jgi:hypothetical protein